MTYMLILAAETVQAANYVPEILPLLRNGLAVASMVIGLFFVLGGTLGVLRLPDFFTRLHAAGMTDTLGAELILLGLIIQEGFTQLSLKFLFVSIFLLLTSPTATHAVANAAYQAGLKPLLGKYKIPTAAEISGDYTKQDDHHADDHSSEDHH